MQCDEQSLWSRFSILQWKAQFCLPLDLREQQVRSRPCCSLTFIFIEPKSTNIKFGLLSTTSKCQCPADTQHKDVSQWQRRGSRKRAQGWCWNDSPPYANTKTHTCKHTYTERHYLIIPDVWSQFVFHCIIFFSQDPRTNKYLFQLGRFEKYFLKCFASVNIMIHEGYNCYRSHNSCVFSWSASQVPTSESKMEAWESGSCSNTVRVF